MREKFAEPVSYCANKWLILCILLKRALLKRSWNFWLLLLLCNWYNRVCLLFTYSCIYILVFFRSTDLNGSCHCLIFFRFLLDMFFFNLYSSFNHLGNSGVLCSVRLLKGVCSSTGVSRFGTNFGIVCIIDLLLCFANILLNMRFIWFFYNHRRFLSSVCGCLLLLNNRCLGLFCLWGSLGLFLHNLRCLLTFFLNQLLSSMLLLSHLFLLPLLLCLSLLFLKLFLSKFLLLNLLFSFFLFFSL